jgi:uncharacterized membrane protein YvbJ
MKSCPRCGRQNEEDVQFCGRCALNFHEYQTTASEASSEEGKFCYRHPKESTSLSCGRCEKPICTKCVIIGPAGPRCKECAKHNVAVRPGAIAYQAKQSLFSLGRFGPWGVYAIILCVVTLFSLFSNCRSQPKTKVTTGTSEASSMERD